VLLTLLVLAFAVVSYVEWSSTVAVAEFMSATEASASDPNQSNESPASIQSLKGRTGCPQGKRPLPTELMPLPLFSLPDPIRSRARVSEFGTASLSVCGAQSILVALLLNLREVPVTQH
jgi:hypothetical protein